MNGGSEISGNLRAVDMSRLRSSVAGQVMLPGDAGYDSARALWNAMVDRRPSVVVRCTSSADVAAAIDFARSSDLEIGVRCGGHSLLGISVPEGGLLIDLSGLRAVRVDPNARRAWVQGGALLRELDRAAQQFGLATTAGNVSHTGVGGLTLGGGMGWLARRFGLACDNVTSYQLVTADGTTLRVSESQHQDLFWALRGGGGNFGVVTEFEFRLHEVGASALLVDNTFDLAEAPGAMRRWRDLLGNGVPEYATPTAWVGTMPDSPDVQEPLRNRTMANLGFVWVGRIEEGRTLVPVVASLGSRAARSRVMAAPSLRRRTPTARSAIATPWWSSLPPLLGPTLLKIISALLRPAATAPRLSHMPAAFMSMCSATKARPAYAAPTRPGSWPGSPR